MASLNKVMLIGNAGKDAELRYLANGTAQAKFSLAVNRNFKGPDGEWKEETEWFNVETWDKLAEICSQSLLKGRSVYVEGRLRTRSWDGQDGQKKYRTEVIANTVTFLDSNRARTGEPGAATADAGGDVEPDDLPF